MTEPHGSAGRRASRSNERAPAGSCCRPTSLREGAHSGVDELRSGGADLHAEKAVDLVEYGYARCQNPYPQTMPAQHEEGPAPPAPYVPVGQVVRGGGQQAQALQLEEVHLCGQ